MSLVIATLQVQKFYTAPTLIRSLMREGDDHVTGSDTSSLQVLGTVGEPINPEAWKWYHSVSANQICMFSLTARKTVDIIAHQPQSARKAWNW